MQTEDSQKITSRFFVALRQLIDDGKLKGKQTFCTMYGINRRNMYQFEKNLEKDIFQVAWLSYLVKDFNVSPEWLLTGEGSFYNVPQSFKK
ncbi:hypothetical protein ACIXT9_02120 [Bacteroides fragilis]